MLRIGWFTNMSMIRLLLLLTLSMVGWGQTAIVRVGQNNTYTSGYQNFNDATFGSPRGTTDPATCSVGDRFVNTTTTPGISKTCLTTNTWGIDILGTLTNANAVLCVSASGVAKECVVSSTIPGLVHTANGAASTPIIVGTGTWFTGGTSTTTKPYVLIEPSGTTSTGWSTSGTGLGVNAASGFAGNLLDVQLNGANRMSLTSGGLLTITGQIVTTGNVTFGNTAFLQTTSRANFSSPADGVWLAANAAVNDFNRFQFGGTTSSFPSVKRSTTGLIARLADDSADTWFQASQFRSTLTTPASASATCVTGTIVADTDYIYVCTATDTWKRVAIATW